MNTQAPDFMATALQHWGEDMPAWVIALAEACAEHSQGAVAKQLKVSPAWVNGILRRKPQFDVVRAEELVAGAFMRRVVDCPALGELPLNECSEWRQKARNFKPHNRVRVMMHRACRGCPHNARGVR